MKEKTRGNYRPGDEPGDCEAADNPGTRHSPARVAACLPAQQGYFREYARRGTGTAGRSPAP